MTDKVGFVYEWHGPEHPLSRLPCTVTCLHVNELKESGKEQKSFTAQGMIAIMDYIENCPGSHLWAAQGIETENGIEWKVQCVDTDPFWKNKDGTVAFTASSEIDKGMDAFIKERLSYAVSLMRKDPGAEVIERPTRYQGSMQAHKGKCICSKLSKSKVGSSFDWQKWTKGKYAEHCFACSCGRCWWRYDRAKELWAPVPDQVAWHKLTQANGEADFPMTILEDGVYHVTTLRQRGWIPLG